jgi:hypothetical protein
VTELMKPVSPADGMPVEVALDVQSPSVRELLTELAALEDATRTTGVPRHERLAALAREQEIIDELHRRCPESSGPLEGLSATS